MKCTYFKFFAAMLLCVSFCSEALSNPPLRPFRKRGDGGINNDIYVVLFILDGTRQDFLYKLIEDGTLPTLKQYFWDEGIHAKDAVTVFPSASAPAYQSFITGMSPGHAGVPYLQRFDRESERVIEYLGVSDYDRVNADLTATTIMERLPGAKTAAIYSEITKGAKIIFPKIPLAALADVFIFHRPEMVDVRAYRKVKELFSNDEPPKFALVGLYSADLIQHKEGAACQDARYVLKQFDIFMGEFIGLLKDRGLFEKTYIIVTADHGMHDINRKIDLRPLFKKAGIKVKPRNPRDKNWDIFISERGVASAQIYLKPGTNKKQDIISVLKGSDDVKHVFIKDDHSVNKMSEFQENKQRRRGGFSSIRLRRTWKMKPAVPPLLVLHNTQTIFDDGRAGDIFIVAKDDAGFYREKKATHGSTISDDMKIPLLIRGPGVAAGEFEHAKSVDLYPTMLSWFGLKPESGIDGRLINVKTILRQRQ